MTCLIKERNNATPLGESVSLRTGGGVFKRLIVNDLEVVHCDATSFHLGVFLAKTKKMTFLYLDLLNATFATNN
jgi:hypothetical protein